MNEKRGIGWVSGEIPAAARIAKFCDEYALMGGIDPNNVYRLHLGSERECAVTIEDLRALVAEVDRLRTEPPNDDEPSKAEIEAALEAVQHYYMLFGDLHGKSIRLSERTVREILTTALRAAVAARRVRPQPPNED